MVRMFPNWVNWSEAIPKINDWSKQRCHMMVTVTKVRIQQHGSQLTRYNNASYYMQVNRSQLYEQNTQQEE